MPTVRNRSYGLVPNAIDADGKRLYLILRAYRNWDFPKGAADRGETPLQAAIREFREETGLAKFEMPWGEVSKDTTIYANGKVATYFLAQVKQQVLTLPISKELGRPEHDEYRWVSAEEAATLLPPRLQPILAWAISATPPKKRWEFGFDSALETRGARAEGLGKMSCTRRNSSHCRCIVVAFNGLG